MHLMAQARKKNEAEWGDWKEKCFAFSAAVPEWAKRPKLESDFSITLDCHFDDDLGC